MPVHDPEDRDAFPGLPRIVRQVEGEEVVRRRIVVLERTAGRAAACREPERTVEDVHAPEDAGIPIARDGMEVDDQALGPGDGVSCPGRRTRGPVVG